MLETVSVGASQEIDQVPHLRPVQPDLLLLLPGDVQEGALVAHLNLDHDVSLRIAEAVPTL